MTDDFMVIDFVLTPSGAGDVAQALGRLAAARGTPQPPETPAEPSAPRRGFLARLLGSVAGRRGAASCEQLRIHPFGHLPASPLARVLPDDLGFGAGATPFRLATPIGSTSLTLVEFRDGDGETSSIAAALSAELPGAELFYFRLSGLRHPGSETAFHIYRDGRATRRAASVSREGTAPEADWRVVDTGLPHAVEAESLAHARARAWEIMTPERQGAILTAMGVDPDALFSAAPGRITLDLSTDAGGRGIGEVWQILAQAETEPETPASRSGEAPAGTGADAAQSAPGGTSGQPSEDGRARGREPAAPARAGAQPSGSRGAPTAPPPPAPARPASAGPLIAPPAAAAPGAGAAQQDPDSWETEVTRLLVRAVAHALPENEHIPWLTHLTSKLETGEIEEALEEARALIEVGDRPAEERTADIERLFALFGSGPEG